MDPIYPSIVNSLELAAKKSKYKRDADEYDPRYKAYGVRKPEVSQIIKQHKKEILALRIAERIALADQLIRSQMGEEQTIAFFILGESVEYFDDQDDLTQIEAWMKNFYGWSKIDGFAGCFLPQLLEKHEKEVIELARKWNGSQNLWERRASVVLFTRKIAESGKYFDEAINLCTNLKWDVEDYVRKGVGWCLKDNLRANKEAVVDLIKQWRREGVSSVITLYAIRDIKDKAERKAILNLT